MGRSKPTKPSRAARKAVPSATAAPAQPHVPSWFDEVPPFIALAFVAMALGTIPYGAPMPAWFMWTMAVVGAALGIALVADPLSRWRTLTYWPIPVILGVWACSIAACDFPMEVLQRSWSMAWYSGVFVAVQVACWANRAIKGLAMCCLATIVLIAADLWFQAFDSRSLLREIRWPEIRWMGYWNWNQHTGSIANVNDHAVLAVLLPLCLLTVPTRWAWGLLALGFAASLYDIWITRSRQMMLGLLSGLATVIGLHAPRKIRWWSVCGIVGASALLIVINPSMRDRLSSLMSDPLGGRTIFIVHGLELFREHPLFGVGPSLYGHYHALSVREGWTFRGQTLGEFGIPWVHCVPVEIACEMGVVGAGAYAAAAWILVTRLRRAHAVGGVARDLAIAVTGSALAMGLMGFVDLTFIKDWVRICWWLLLGLGFAAPTLPGAQDKPKAATLPSPNGL